MTVALNLDLRNTQADTGNEPVPAGWYVVMIDESSLQPTAKDPNNKMLKLRFNVIEGQFAGRKLFETYNIIHSNVMTQEIAQRQLKAVCVAVGHHGMLSDSGELHGKPLRVSVKVRKATEEYEASNAIKTYLSMTAPIPAGATTAVAQAAPAAAPAAFGAQPWTAAAATPAMPPATAGAPIFPAAAPAAAAPAPAALPWASAPADVAAAAAAPVAAPAVPPAAPAPAPVAAPVAQPVKRMTEKAAGATYEQFVANKWTDEAMVKEGYMVIEQPAPVAAPAAPAVPSAPAVPASPPAAAAAVPGTPMTPPWATQAA